MLFFAISIFLKNRSRTVKMFFGFMTFQQPKAKYLIPRDPHLRSAYRTSKLYRAKLKIHAVWCFQSVLHVGILEETTFHGSSMVWDLIATTLEYVIAEYRRKRMAEPDTLIVVGDNTVKELKNSICPMALANLINHRKLRFLVWIIIMFFLFCLPDVNMHTFPDVRFSCAMMMRVSHTHDVVGSLVIEPMGL